MIDQNLSDTSHDFMPISLSPLEKSIVNLAKYANLFMDKSLMRTVVALFFLWIEHKIPEQHIHGQNYEHRDVRPVFGKQKVVIKCMEFHCAPLCLSGRLENWDAHKAQACDTQ
jgi:hypothetical protein